MRTEALTAPPSQRWCLACRRPIEEPGQVFCANCGTLLPDAPPLDGRYAIGDSLGEGGFGHTYLAHDTRTRKPVAIKRVPRRNMMGDAMLTPRHFDRELNLLAELNTPGHPNIPEVLDTFGDAQADYLVMKYITGQTLKKKLELNGAFPWEAVGPILEQVLSALAYMKAQPEPVVHGDIKPNNLIEDETGRLFLVDFGMARRKSAGGNWATESDAVAGTPGFASWDLWRGGPSPASDVYALGMTAFVLLAGLERYDELISRERALDQRFTPHPGLTLDDLEQVDISDGVRELLCAATATEPRERPTADDLLKSLVAQKGRKNMGLSAAATNYAQRPLYFPNGTAAQTELEFVKLADGQLKIATEFLYQDDTLARWLELQCFRADLAQVVREIREEFPDRREAFEYVLQALDPKRQPAQLTIEPAVTLQRSFLTRGGSGQFTLTNQGPGFARLEVATTVKGVKVQPQAVILGPGETETLSVSAPAGTIAKFKDLGTLKVTMGQLVEPYIQNWPVTAAPAPWWYLVREVVLLAVTVFLALFAWSAVQTWLPCTLAKGLAACPPPPLLPSFLTALLH